MNTDGKHTDNKNGIRFANNYIADDRHINKKTQLKNKEKNK